MRNLLDYLPILAAASAVFMAIFSLVRLIRTKGAIRCQNQILSETSKTLLSEIPKTTLGPCNFLDRNPPPPLVCHFDGHDFDDFDDE